MRPPIAKEYEAWKDEVVAEWRQGITSERPPQRLAWSWCAFVGPPEGPFDVRSTQEERGHVRSSVALTKEQEGVVHRLLRGRLYPLWKARPEVVGLLVHAKDDGGEWAVCENNAPTNAPPAVRRLPGVRR